MYGGPRTPPSLQVFCYRKLLTSRLSESSFSELAAARTCCCADCRTPVYDKVMKRYQGASDAVAVLMGQLCVPKHLRDDFDGFLRDWVLVRWTDRSCGWLEFFSGHDGFG